MAKHRAKTTHSNVFPAMIAGILLFMIVWLVVMLVISYNGKPEPTPNPLGTSAAGSVYSCS